jgi:hypothetical protein
MTRIEAAIRIRDHALDAVRRHGRHQAIGDMAFN